MWKGSMHSPTCGEGGSYSSMCVKYILSLVGCDLKVMMQDSKLLFDIIY